MASLLSSMSSLISRSDERLTKANLLTYPKSSEPFSYARFDKPPVEYRGAPFWAWNGKLDKDRLLRQIDAFKEMGMGGFHMHSRVGLDTEYLGTEYMDLIKTCVDYAESKGMMACLYDEDRWPSGSVGGELTKRHPEHRLKHVVFTVNPRGADTAEVRLLGTYALKLDAEGCLSSYALLAEGQDAGADDDVWYAYEDASGNSPWYNDNAYVDTLSPKAMAEFISMTHELFKTKVGDRFGSTIPCIFTDEPQTFIKEVPPAPNSRQDVSLPWTPDLPKTMQDAYGKNVDLLASLPELFFDLPSFPAKASKASLTRYQYHEHVCERFVSAFMDQIGHWCAQNRLLLNGHMMEEDTLRQQTWALGEAMRCYRVMQVPGIDVLSDNILYNTAKQAVSVTRQRGLRATGSELYGCTHWSFSFQGHKGSGDWQAALGITFRVHHLAWYTMAGEGKRDYPASISYQSPWYAEYSYIEDHFARLGYCLTRGHAVTHVAVLHPIESFWLDWGPGCAAQRDARELTFVQLTDWLLHGLIDFDFVCESLLPGQFGGVEDGQLRVGVCRYSVVIVPNLQTIRGTTLKILKEFAAAGGTVVVAGVAPLLVDAKAPSDGEPVLTFNTTKLAWDRETLVQALEPWREISIEVKTDAYKTAYADKVLYQMRQDGHERFVFICNVEREKSASHDNVVTVHLRGAWNVEALDTMTGDVQPVASKGREWTTFKSLLHGAQSIMLRLTPREPADVTTAMRNLDGYADSLALVSDLMPLKLDEVELSEPNVLLLDYARYRVDDGPWSGPEEVLRIDNEVRSQLGMPLKGGTWKQPWACSDEERAPRARLSLVIDIYSDMDVDFPTKLAIELPSGANMRLNCANFSADAATGWWVDEDIRTWDVPPHVIRKGANVLEIDFPFGILTPVERVYLLGKFKVVVDSNRPRITSWSTTNALPLGWGDTVPQGFPFYAGNVGYKVSFELQWPALVVLQVPEFTNPVLKVTRPDGSLAGHIAIQPRRLELGVLEKGRHEYVITAFGNRYNSFGHVHLINTAGCTPDFWRTSGNNWSDDYQLQQIGVLQQPSVRAWRAKDKDEIEMLRSWALVDKVKE